ncbi:MAG: hypothetical protein M0O96_03780, partial [Desulforhopalus sp.]|nr:hypothetical protein [Desulforhopalus sp.]
KKRIEFLRNNGVQLPVTKAGKRKLYVNSCEKRKENQKRQKRPAEADTTGQARFEKRLLIFFEGDFRPLTGPKKHRTRECLVQ